MIIQSNLKVYGPTKERIDKLIKKLEAERRKRFIQDDIITMLLDHYDDCMVSESYEKYQHGGA